MLLALEALRERWLILLARFGEERTHFGTAAGWIASQWTTLLYGVGIALAGQLIDRTFFDRPYDPANPGWHVVLAPVLAASAATFVFLMTAWLSITQASASRFDSAAVVRRLADDWVGSFVLRSLLSIVFSAIVGLGTPALTGRAVVAGAVLPLALLLLALPLLLVFRQYALFLTHPGRFAQILESDTSQRIMRVSARTPPSRSVAAHYRGLVSRDLEVWEGLLAYSANRDPELHAVIAQRLGLAMAFYWNRKVAIDTGSEWYPYREVLSEDRDLRRIHAEQGLGPARIRERDLLWLERRVLAVLQRTAERESAQHHTRADVLAVLRELLVIGWHRQEMAALAAVRELWTRERTATLPEDYDVWADSVVNGLIRFAEEVLRHGLRISEFLPLRAYPDPGDIARAFLPAEVRTEMIHAADAVESENAIAARTITPLEALSSEVEAHLRQRQDELTAEAVTWLLGEFRSQIERSLNSVPPGSPDGVADLYTSLLVLCNRSYYLGSQQRAAAALGVAVTLAPSALGMLGRAPDQKRLALVREARTLALKAIRDRWSESPQAVRLAIQLVALERTRSRAHGGPASSSFIETILVIGGLAFAAGEVRNDRTLVDLILEELAALGIDRVAFGNMWRTIGRDSVLTLGVSFTLEYHHYAMALYAEAEKLGKKFVQEPGEIGYGELFDSNSRWLQRYSMMPFGIEDAIEAFLAYASGATASDDETET